MKVAIASSGLGHVARGIETWALDTAKALHEKGVDVTLFAASPLQAVTSNIEHGTSNIQHRAEGEGTSVSSARDLPVVVLPSLKRNDAKVDRLVRIMPGFTWRWGLKSGYGWEQFSFWRHLLPHLKAGGFDILHVQDPLVAYWCRRARLSGKLKTREILAHGTEEPIQFLLQFDYVQHLTPWHLDEALAGEGSNIEHRTSNSQHRTNIPESACLSTGASAKEGRKIVLSSNSGQSDTHPHWVAIPNFVDIEVFRPASDDEEKMRCRDKLGIPADAFVIGTAAAVKKPHKRIDYLIKEFALFADKTGRLGDRTIRRQDDRADDSIRNPESRIQNPSPSYLLIAGARTSGSDELVRMAEELCPGRVKFLFDLPRDQMPDYYRALDVWVLTSIFEMMPIAVLEAMSSGLPILTHNHQNLRWMVGSGGPEIDMSEVGGLSETLIGLDSEAMSLYSGRARARAEDTFSKTAVIGQYVNYYHHVKESTQQ